MAKKSWVEREHNKACRYIGGFFYQFTCIEQLVNDVFVQVFNLEGFAEILAHNLELRKKTKAPSPRI
jgi:hypothetical protein